MRKRKGRGRKKGRGGHAPWPYVTLLFHWSRAASDLARGSVGGAPLVRRRVVCRSQRASTRQHKKVLGSGTIGAFWTRDGIGCGPTENTVSSGHHVPPSLYTAEGEG